MGLEKGLAKTKIKNKVIPDAAALNILNHFDFWSAVPVDGSASYAEIAQRTRLPQDVVYRVVQHATTLRLFAETEPGKPSSRIQHTSRSAALANLHPRVWRAASAYRLARRQVDRFSPTAATTPR